MLSKKIFTTAMTISVLLFTTAANSLPTKVKLVEDPNYTSTEGVTVLVSTDKVTIEEDADSWRVYEVFKRAKKEYCYILETETKSSVMFNKKADKSGVKFTKQVSC